MLASVKGMFLTLVSTFRKPVTEQYPNKPRQIQPRYMGFPALTWDFEGDEPFCTSCMVCIRNCPTQCMSATMMDNPLQKEGKSPRKKIVETFEINLNRCILCMLIAEVQSLRWPKPILCAIQLTILNSESFWMYTKFGGMISWRSNYELPVRKVGC